MTLRISSHIKYDIYYTEHATGPFQILLYNIVCRTLIIHLHGNIKDSVTILEKHLQEVRFQKCSELYGTMHFNKVHNFYKSYKGYRIRSQTHFYTWTEIYKGEF